MVTAILCLVVIGIVGLYACVDRQTKAINGLQSNLQQVSAEQSKAINGLQSNLQQMNDEQAKQKDLVSKLTPELQSIKAMLQTHGEQIDGVKKANKEFGAFLSDIAAVAPDIFTNIRPSKVYRNPLSNKTYEDYNTQGLMLMSPDMQTKDSWQFLPDAAGILTSVKATKDILSTFSAVFEPHIQEAIRSGSAALMNSHGSKLAVAVNQATGRILGYARIAGPNVAQIAANVFPVIISGAHLIAGWDNAKTLKKIDRKVTRLLSLDQSDKLAQLEACYEDLRYINLPSRGGDSHLLKRNLNILRTQRIGWRNQFATEFEQVQSASWWEIGPLKGKSLPDALAEIEKLEPLLVCIHQTFQIEAMTLQFLNDKTASLHFLQSVGEEATRLRTLSDKLEQRWLKARGTQQQPDIISLLKGVADCYEDIGKAIL